MSSELAHAAPQCNNLPTPTGIAARIIARAQDLDAEPGDATRLIGQGPALSAHILHLANSLPCLPAAGAARTCSRQSAELCCAPCKTAARRSSYTTNCGGAA